MPPIGSGTIGDVALMEYMWPFWQKYVSVGLDFEVSYIQTMSSVTVASAAY